MHWKTRFALDLHLNGEISGSGGDKDYTFKKNNEEILTIPSEAEQFLSMAELLIRKADTMITKNKNSYDK